MNKNKEIEVVGTKTLGLNEVTQICAIVLDECAKEGITSANAGKRIGLIIGFAIAATDEFIDGKRKLEALEAKRTAPKSQARKD